MRIDDHDLAIGNEIVPVPMEAPQSGDGRAHEFFTPQALQPWARSGGDHSLDGGQTLGGQVWHDRSRWEAVVPPGLQGGGDAQGRGNGRGASPVVAGRRNDQRGSGLVDQHAVDLIDDRDIEGGLKDGSATCLAQHLGHLRREIAIPRVAAAHQPVAQIVESDLLSGHERDRRAIGDLPLDCRSALDDDAGFDA